MYWYNDSVMESGIWGPYWKWYQKRVADLFRKIEGAVVDEDVTEVGQDSGVPRQLDVRVQLPLSIDVGQGFEIEVPVKIIVDAKAHSQPLDVKDIEEIAGLKDDVRANLAVAVTPEGVSEGGRQRGRALGVYPITVTGDLLALLEALEDFSSCLICEYDAENDDGPPPWVNWHDRLRGFCHRCSSLHVRCPDCLEIIGVPEGQYGIGVRCGGECGAVFVADFDAKEMEEKLTVFDALDTSLLTTAYRKSTKRLTAKEVHRLVQRTRWQHWGVASPTIDLTEEGLMRWEEDGCLYLTDEGTQTVEGFLLDPAYPYCY